MWGRAGKIFVVDPERDKVSVVDPHNDFNIMSSFDMTPAGLNPHSLVVTRDEGKLYVAVEQPAPQGVVRIVELNETKAYPAHSIDGVNCPEGLAISPDGRKL